MGVLSAVVRVGGSKVARLVRGKNAQEAAKALRTLENAQNKKSNLLQARSDSRDVETLKIVDKAIKWFNKNTATSTPKKVKTKAEDKPTIPTKKRGRRGRVKTKTSTPQKVKTKAENKPTETTETTKKSKKKTYSTNINNFPEHGYKAPVGENDIFVAYRGLGYVLRDKKTGVESWHRFQQGGRIMKKAHGGKMSHVGLYPAEEARSGTMSEAKRKKYAKKGGPVKKYHKGKQIKKAAEILKTHELVGKEGLSGRFDPQTKKKKPPKYKSGGAVKKKTGGVVKKQAGGPFKQGYKAREDESLGMRTGPESGKTQSMAARRDESYGDWGKRKRGRVNIKKGGSVRKLKKGGQVRKMSEGGTLVASLYETIS